MARPTGRYCITSTLGEEVQAFVPHPLPPTDPPLAMDGAAAELHAAAQAALARLAVAGAMVPSTDWFLYGFVRKEAVITSQIEGTQATLRDVLTFEATAHTDRPDDVQEVCNYVDAVARARRQLVDPKGLPLSIRLLRDAHRTLMRGARGADKLPGELRRSQNWIGGSRPGTARFVPPPPAKFLLRSRRSSDGATLIATSHRWCGPDSPTCSSRRSTRFSTATAALADC